MGARLPVSVTDDVPSPEVKTSAVAAVCSRPLLSLSVMVKLPPGQLAATETPPTLVAVPLVA